MYDELAGILTEDDNGYHFLYLDSYLYNGSSESISLTLPIAKKSFNNSVLFPFFDGLIPEGWLLNIAEKNWKLNPRDRMGILLETCGDCIGAVSIRK
ncbi:MAG: HipA N-terminal domain-containing protein [Spirochaetaceae bacterium]